VHSVSILLALGCAVAYGLSDFVGGVLSRRTSMWAVAVAAQMMAAVVTTGLALVFTGDVEPADWFWALVAGVGGGAGTVFLYRGLGSGRMGVVAPLSAVGTALVPLAVGVAAGERPGALTWTGVVLALPAVWMVARTPEAGPVTGSAVDDMANGLSAGLGFGVLFAALGQVPDQAGLGPLALTQWTAVGVTIAVALALGAAWVPRDRAALTAASAGVLSSAATLMFLLSTQSGLLTVAGVLAALYPAVTVVLAAIVLREAIHRHQAVGLALTAVAVALVAAG